MKYLLIALLQIGVGMVLGFMVHEIYFVDKVEHEIVEIEVKVELTEEQQKAIDDFEAEKEILQKEEYEKGKEKFEASKERWLKENPPVDYLFDRDRRMDKDYVMFYLGQFPISGDCALVWIQDVICWNGFSGGLKFPTERPE